MNYTFIAKAQASWWLMKKVYKILFNIILYFTKSLYDLKIMK